MIKTDSTTVYVTSDGIVFLDRLEALRSEHKLLIDKTREKVEELTYIMTNPKGYFIPTDFLYSARQCRQLIDYSTQIIEILEAYSDELSNIEDEIKHETEAAKMTGTDHG